MALNAIDFVNLGPIRSADLKQFVDLFTGVMIDQPVTFKNTLSVGGSQGQAVVPLKLYGAIGQSGHLVDLYPDTTSLNPTFGFAAYGSFGWGAGGQQVIDSTLSRIGGTPDTPGLVISPRLDVLGPINPHGPISWPSGGSVADALGQSLNIGPNVIVPGTLSFDVAGTAQISLGTTAGLLNIKTTLLVNSAHASDLLVPSVSPSGGLAARGPDLPDAASQAVVALSAQTFGVNWHQFNVRFVRLQAGTAWPGVALGLLFDVDNNIGQGGQIWYRNGKIGLGGQPVLTGASAQAVQVFGDLNGGAQVLANSFTCNTDWFRLGTMDRGIYSNAAGFGIAFNTTSGAYLYPSGVPIVGTTTTQTLSNKAIVNLREVGPSTVFAAAGNDLTNYVFNYVGPGGAITLPQPSPAYIGVFRAAKAWGGDITVNCPTQSIMPPGSNGSIVASFVLHGGDSVTFWCDGSYWWGL